MMNTLTHSPTLTTLTYAITPNTELTLHPDFPKAKITKASATKDKLSFTCEVEVLGTDVAGLSGTVTKDSITIQGSSKDAWKVKAFELLKRQ